MVDNIGWFQAQWPPWEQVDIATKELVPVAVAAALWGSRWKENIFVFTLTTWG